MTRYVHTNIIAKDAEKLIDFYKKVFGCRSIGEKRDLKGEWLDKVTGLKNAHITGEHLVLSGYDEDHPTLEIFSYDQMEGDLTHKINQYGIAHIACEVDNVRVTLDKLLQNGGATVGEVVSADYPNRRKATFVYAADIEGNIIELQSWG